MIGGPFDGERGLYAECEPDEVPSQIEVGRCRGNGDCGLERCAAYGRVHLAFWVAEAGLPPIGTTPYVRIAIKMIDEDRGRAEYVHGELDFGDFVTERDREMVGAGYDGGVAYG